MSSRQPQAGKRMPPVHYNEFSGALALVEYPLFTLMLYSTLIDSRLDKHAIDPKLD